MTEQEFFSKLDEIRRDLWTVKLCAEASGTQVTFEKLSAISRATNELAQEVYHGGIDAIA